MTVQNIDRKSYHDALLYRANRVEKRLGDSLRHWAAQCDPGNLPSRNGQTPVSLVRLETHARDLIVPIPGHPFRGMVERNGICVTDHPLALVNLSPSIVLPTGVVIHERGLFAEDFRSCPVKWREIGWYMPSALIGFYNYNIEDDTAVAYLSDFSEVEDSVRPYFLFQSNYSGRNFAHLIHDTLSQLLAFEYLAQRAGVKPIPVLSERLRFPMQEFLFRKLVSSLEEVFYLPPHPVKIQNCFAATKPCFAADIAFDAFRHLRSRFEDLKTEVEALDSFKVPKVYISRSDATGPGRQFANVDELERELCRLGFATVVISQCRPTEILKIFDGCKVVAGIHGAGLVNAFFARPETRILEFSDHPPSSANIPAIFTATGYDFIRIPPILDAAPSTSLPRLDAARCSELALGVGGYADINSHR
jgi:hypothetical protein